VLVVVGALALVAVPLAFGADLRGTLLRAMTFMIVASPCAIVLATMPPLLAAIAVAGRRGVLLKDATVVETLAEVDAVALDKTGTVTRGRPEVRDVRPLAGTADALLALAAAAEAGSEHVLGRAVVAEARRRGLALAPATDFAAVPGSGVRAVVGGREVWVGRSATPAVDHTVVDVLVDGEPAGTLVLADELRPGARAAVAALADAVGEAPALLTGDAAGPAEGVAARAGVSRVHAGLLPADKAAIVDGWRAEGRTVLAVGDGINDAPLLATADVGLAVAEGAGSLSAEAADGVLLRDPLGAPAPLVTLARRACRVARANLAFAAAVIVGLVVWDLAGTLPLAVGVAGHELSTVLVCLNGLRLLVRPGWPEAVEGGERHGAQERGHLVGAAP
jgi:P-type E1-E2 ATPase